MLKYLKWSPNEIETNQTQFDGWVVGFNFNLGSNIRFNCIKLKKQRKKKKNVINWEKEREKGRGSEAFGPVDPLTCDINFSQPYISIIWPHLWPSKVSNRSSFAGDHIVIVENQLECWQSSHKVHYPT